MADEVKSHSEALIVLECIGLMQDMVGRFQEYLDWLGVEYPTDEKDEAYFSTGMTYGEIICKLLLRHTNHSGGTSTAQKCRELGFDYGEVVPFEFEQEDEE